MPAYSYIYIVSLEHQYNSYEPKIFDVKKAFKSLGNANAYARELLQKTHPDAGEWDQCSEYLNHDMLKIVAGLYDGDQVVIIVKRVVVEDEVVID